MGLPRTLLRLLLLLLAGVALVRALGAETGTVMVLLVGLLPVVLLPAYPAVLAAAVLRDRLAAGLALLLVAAHLLLVAPAVRARPVSPQALDALRLRVAVANLYVLNPDPAATGRALRRLDLDVLVVPELSSAGLAGLRGSGLLADLPHAVLDTPVTDGELTGTATGTETVGLFSRLPLAAPQLRRGSARVLPRATVEVGGVPVRLLATHPLPPVGPFQWAWRSGLDDLAGEVRGSRAPVVALGDLNGDRDHAAFRDLLDVGLRDVADERGEGLMRTWPAAAPLLHLDHVLVRDGERGRLEALDVRAVRLPGTDHLAVVADLAVLPGRRAAAPGAG